MKVLFTSPLGITFERTDYRNRSKVKVSSHGYNHRTYRFNNVPEFKSPYISWQNLDCCNGWAYDNTYLKSSVQNGTKLFAQIIHDREEIFDAAPGVEIATRPHGWLENHCETHLYRTGCLSDYYDLDAVFEHYSRLGIDLEDGEIDLIRDYCSIELSVFATDQAPVDYANVESIEDLIVTGLLLGYPLESTASIIEEWYL